jgi:hypothetical protein
MPKAGTVTAIISDTHIGGFTGLSLPKWEITGNYGEGIPIEASPAQLWIYNNFLDFWRYVALLAEVKGKYRKHRIICLHLGDIVDGNHHNSIQQLPNPDDQIDMAAHIMTNIASLADGGVYGCMGTEPTHAGSNGAHERTVAQWAGFKLYAPELQLNIDGVEVLAFHHGAASRNQWTSRAAGMAARMKLECLDSQLPQPRYVFAGHNHIIDDSGEKVPGTRAVSCPAWQLKTGFGYRAAAGIRSDIGGIIILPDGSLDFSKSRYRADAPGQRRSMKA